MELSKIKQVLYESDEIKNIPDKWQELLPVFCKYQNDIYDVFLYVSGQQNVEIKLAILISQDLKIKVLPPNEILSNFELTSLHFPIKQITDYQKYFSLKDKYINTYQKIHNMLQTENINISPKINDCIKLLEKIFGENLYKECFLKITMTINR